MNQERRFEELLTRLIDCGLPSAERDELAALCEGRPDRAAEVREELGFAEMLRQAIQAESPEAAFARRVETHLNRPPQELDPLLSKLLDEEMTEPDFVDLEHLCITEPAAAHRLREELAWNDLLDQAASPHRSEEAFVDALVTRMWAETEEDDFLGKLESKIVEMHPAPNPREKAGRFLRWMPYTAAAAAVLAAAATFTLHRGTDGGTVASLKQTVGEVRWGQGYAPDGTGRLRPGSYRLESGLVTVRFDSGTELALEAPAEFDVTGAAGANVLKGLAVARVSKEGESFNLKSRGLNLGETGDTIGVDAREAGATEAVVFNGGAELRVPDFGTKRSLYEFEAVRAEQGRSKLVDIPYNPAPFTQAWAMVSGVQTKTGQVSIEMPGSPMKPTRSSENGRVQVYLENERLVLDQPLEVDPLEPGKITLAQQQHSPTLPRGELRSYLVQLWPQGASKEKMEASLTFSHEVVGVIYSSDRLATTDSVVGAQTGGLPQGGSDHHQRGLDLSGEAGDDEIVLSQDRRTVNVKLHSGGTDQMDQVRILVAVK